jgi:hypothetical protein
MPQTAKDPNYFKAYYENNKDKARKAKSKSYAIHRCGLSPNVAKHLGEKANLGGRFQKLYLQLQNDCPDVLEFMLQYLADGMLFDEPIEVDTDSDDSN